MKRQPKIRVLSIPLLILLFTSNVYPQRDCQGGYPGAPTAIVELAALTAEEIVAVPDSGSLEKRTNRPSELMRYLPRMFVYAIADALTDIRNFRAAPLIAETARTDKQIGASATGEGTTSAVEKPSFSNLLGIAVERGAVQQSVDKTSLTLSTSPYALLLLTRGTDADTAAFYDQNEFFDRIGVSANFNLSNPDTPLASATRRQLNEWSVRVRLFGNHSPRSKDFIDKWDSEVRPLVNRRLEAISDAESKTFDEPSINGFRQEVTNKMREDFQEVLKTLTGVQEKRALDVEKVKQWILCQLKRVFDKVVEGERNPNASFRIDAVTRDKIKTDVVRKLRDANDTLLTLREQADKVAADIQRRPLLTLAYSNKHVETGSDYSTYKLLYQQGIWRPMTMTVNVGASFYAHPDPTKNQERWRDLAAAVSFEGKANSPFNTGEADLSKITYSFNFRYQTMRENRGVTDKKADLAVGQFKLELPIKLGVSIPFSVTYANATELIKEREVRGNFGITFDVDKLFTLTRGIFKQ